MSLDPVKAKFDFAEIVHEVVQHFTLNPDAKIPVSVEIQSEDANGFDEGMQMRSRKTVTRARSRRRSSRRTRTARSQVPGIFADFATTVTNSGPHHGYVEDVGFG